MYMTRRAGTKERGFSTRRNVFFINNKIYLITSTFQVVTAVAENKKRISCSIRFLFLYVKLNFIYKFVMQPIAAATNPDIRAVPRFLAERADGSFGASDRGCSYGEAFGRCGSDNGSEYPCTKGSSPAVRVYPWKTDNR